LKVKPGAYNIEVRGKGGYGFSIVTVGFEQTVSAKVKLVYSIPLKVTSEPFEAGADIWVDGVVVGQIPAEVKVIEGTHKLEVKGKSSYGFQNFAANADQSVSTIVKLSRNPFLKITSIPLETGAEVLLNGKPVGAIPVELSVAQGEYILVVIGKTLSGYQKVTAGDDQIISANVKLDQSSGSSLCSIVDITVEPAVSGVDIYADGKILGTAPLVARLKEGKHSITAKRGMSFKGVNSFTAKCGAYNKVAVKIMADANE
jgi:hypothetical protein